MFTFGILVENVPFHTGVTPPPGRPAVGTGKAIPSKKMLSTFPLAGTALIQVFVPASKVMLAVRRIGNAACFRGG